MSDLSGEAVSLFELPLPDPEGSADLWDVAAAARLWKNERAASLNRDENSQREVELQERLEEAYRRGLVDGRAAAEAEGLELVRGLNDSLAGAVRQSDALVRAVLEEAAQEMVAGSWLIAKWALGRELALDPTALLDMAASALGESGGVAGSRIYVNPALGRAASRWASRFGLDAPDIVEDPAVEPGTVTVKSAHAGTATVSLTDILNRSLELLGLDDQSGGAR